LNPEFKPKQTRRVQSIPFQNLHPAPVQSILACIRHHQSSSSYLSLFFLDILLPFLLRTISNLSQESDSQMLSVLLQSRRRIVHRPRTSVVGKQGQPKAPIGPLLWMELSELAVDTGVDS
jgi:hypothetical protein